ETIEFNFGSTIRPPGAPLDESWLDNYVLRSIRDISVQAGEYNFIVRADDGVRLRWDSVTTPDLTSPYKWNIADQWGGWGSITYVPVTLAAGDYRLILEFYEAGGNAYVSVQAGNTNFSFSDSPKTSDIVPSVAYGNSSLLLDGVLNVNRPTGLTAAQWKPRLSYYTGYALGDNAVARVEISTDGGFNWRQDHLNENCPSGTQCDPSIWGWNSRLVPPYGNEEWQLRIHDLRYYGNLSGTNNYLGLRFRLLTQNSVRDGWWVTDILADNAP
ncbi:MAG TPA: hypothetical protein VHO69_16800, partial [Phototrophicaceae bacterium]|nr:hypothetical protein [Phototrophicaceae bacterium]